MAKKKKYYHEVVGCNSRLDTLQAAILNVKLPYLDTYLEARKAAGAFYQKALKISNLHHCPTSLPATPTTCNQFTLKIKDGLRDRLKEYLAERRDSNHDLLLFAALQTTGIQQICTGGILLARH